MWTFATGERASGPVGRQIWVRTTKPCNAFTIDRSHPVQASKVQWSRAADPPQADTCAAEGSDAPPVAREITDALSPHRWLRHINTIIGQAGGHHDALQLAPIELYLSYYSVTTNDNHCRSRRTLTTNTDYHPTRPLPRA